MARMRVAYCKAKNNFEVEANKLVSQNKIALKQFHIQKTQDKELHYKQCSHLNTLFD